MAIAITLQNFLASKGAQYDVVFHEPTMSSRQTARAAHIPAGCLVKSVILEDEHGYLMAVVPADCKVRVADLDRQLHRRLRFATEEQLAGLFADCERGAVPPLGVAYGMETVVDRSIESAAEVYFEGGDHQVLVRMRGTQFTELMKDAGHSRFAEHL
jgi:Ala-tRNA(Pro) deacylase